MKYRIRKLFALTLALSMLLSMIPFGMAAESLDEFAGYETLDEIPFEFELEPGDLPFEQLKDATLAAEDIPYCIDPTLIEERGHVNRLYLQEPDDCTVMFQNRDGSKTVYVFSHPVKGMTMTTTASIQVNGSVISFSGTNAISSRIAELSDYNIGYSEVAYIPTGILSADGIDLTEDARGWARGESMPSSLSYNISSEAAAEYAASITIPDTEIATAAVTPGVTITPNDPAPLGGMTVMSISYSDLAGLMSLKNMAINQYLTMTNSSSPSLFTSSSISVPYSRWFVQYDSTRGYILSNINNVFDTYMGRMSGQSTLTIGPKTSIDYVFGLRIVSTSDATVTIGFNDYAIDSTLSICQRNPEDDDFPTACEWKIYNKQDITLVSGISCSATRTEECGSGFFLNYTVYPTTADYYEIDLYYASTGQSVEHDTESYEGDEYEYFINTPGTYTVYYKDSVTGIQSQNFTLQIVEYVTEIGVPSSVRVEQKNVGFELDYSFDPPSSDYHSISLYYADTNTKVPHTGDTYTISTPGVYTVYYKDSYSGVRSDNFLLVITEANNFESNKTYSIRPVNAPTYYLTMNGSSVSENGNNSIGVSNISYGITTTATTTTATPGVTKSIENNFERWNNKSKLFTFEEVEGVTSTYRISAILCTEQATIPTGTISSSPYQSTDYVLRNEKLVPNTICYSETDVQTKKRTNYDTDTQIIICNMGAYYILLCYNQYNSDNNTIKALKYTADDVSVADYNATDNISFRWYINHVGVNAPLIMQTRNNSCGFTNVLQVLYGAGMEDVANGTNLAAQIENIAYRYEKTTGPAYSETVYSNIKSKLIPSLPYNNTQYSIHHPDPDETSVTMNSKSDMIEEIEASLDLGWAPIILTYAGHAPYKFDFDAGYAHFVCVIGYDSISDSVILSNCHYQYKPHYSNVNAELFGVYAVDADDFYLAVAYLYVMS